MPQILKDDIKDRIVRAACRLFIVKGFDNVPMTMIADEAGVAVGNIYRYFKGKNGLFRHLAKPVADKLLDLFKSPMTDYSNEEVDRKINGFLRIYNEDRELLFLILENSHNTEFNNLKRKITDGFSESVRRWQSNIPLEMQKYYDDSFIRAFSAAFINGSMSIIADEYDDELKRDRLCRFATFMKNSLYRDFVEKGI